MKTCRINKKDLEVSFSGWGLNRCLIPITLYLLQQFVQSCCLPNMTELKTKLLDFYEYVLK